MRGEPQPIQVRGLYHDGVWTDEMRHIEINRSVSDAVSYGLGIMNVTPAGIRYVPFQAVVSPLPTCTLAKAVRASIGVSEPELALVDSDYVRAE